MPNSSLPFPTRLSSIPSTPNLMKRTRSPSPSVRPSTLSLGGSSYKKATAPSLLNRKPLSTPISSSNQHGLSRTTTFSKPTPTSSTPSNLTSTLLKTPSMESVQKKIKRPAWDTKGRLEDLEKKFEDVQTKLNDSMKSSNQLEDQYKSEKKKGQELESKVITYESELQNKNQQIHTLQLEIGRHQQEHDLLQERHRQQIQLIEATHQSEFTRLKLDHEALQRAHAQLQKDYEAQSNEHATLKSTFQLTHGSMAHLEVQLKAKSMHLETYQTQLLETQSQLSIQTDRVHELEDKLRADERTRRHLHNTIQELKGNIRVFCRIRPALEKEVNALSTFTITLPDAVEFQDTRDSAEGKSVVKTYPFQFDRVFRQDESQATVFDEISQLVQSALDGYNVCIFAYGQTGSGKTYTMEGLRDSEHLGMIPRAVHQLFDTSELYKNKGWDFKFEGTFLEIYNEQLRDLLDPVTKSDETSKKFEIRHVNQKTSVTDLTVLPLTSPHQVLQALEKASKHRAVGATLMNERSSRSHSVFTVSIVGTHSLTSETMEAKLNLIDLAGSERLHQSGATGDRLKETQSINKSLSALGDVIMALANRDPHIPYRNSKLTYLLQQSLGGNSKTLMFVNISPSLASFNESLNSLRFATKVNACQIGTARKVVASKLS
ncbi:hypothetical protein HMI54_007213 [Coelomomyces lativittatus]|nr:hypothetical protein HMI54_007213 [Coelomomyces lativittatus]KAJ1506145.1 hypothetical protein HMI55_001294 [Coelomomyces lativittatus]KAJ1511624.1 hypothetical protein HMI56_005152 [Coelomomyces lativittatus]